jgi:D-3-phosphoglycerate dehydrogenase
MRFRVLSLPSIHEDAIRILESVAEVRMNTRDRSLTKEELLSEVGDIDAVIVGGEMVDEDVLGAARNLKVVSRFGVGYDNVDVGAATRRGILVTYTPGVLSNAVAELTMGLILCLSRRLLRADAFVRSGEWHRGGRFPLTMDLVGKQLGVVGLGRIGSEVARRAKAFGMRLSYYDLVRNPGLEEELQIEYLPLEEVLSRSDFVSIHVALTDRTRKMIGPGELSLMKGTAYLVNTSRGGVVDQAALYEALKERRIAGAALDVFEREPIPADDPLLKLENVVVVPHIGSATVETRRRMSITAAENVTRVLEGGSPLFAVNPEVLCSR